MKKQNILTVISLLALFMVMGCITSTTRPTVIELNESGSGNSTTLITSNEEPMPRISFVVDYAIPYNALVQVAIRNTGEQDINSSYLSTSIEGKEVNCTWNSNISKPGGNMTCELDKPCYKDQKLRISSSSYSVTTIC